MAGPGRPGRPKGGKNRAPVGPFSRDRSLTTLDKRTKAGRVLRQTRLDLADHVGGAPTAAERLIIESAAVKATRLYLLSEKLLNGGDISSESDHHALAWLNSLRLDLSALGLEKRIKDVTPTLATILAQHRADEAAQSAEAAQATHAAPDIASRAGKAPAVDCEAAE
jgi:hypothetical protein